VKKLSRRAGNGSLADYSVLLMRVRETFVRGQERAEEIKLQTYWEGGRLIHEHLEFHEDNSAYGKQVIVRLARNLEVGEHLLYRMVRFYEAFPILASRLKLSWSHYRTLARLPDSRQRLQIESQAARESWTSEKLERHISYLTNGACDSADGTKTGGTPTSRSVQLLEPKRGSVGIYRIVADGDSLAVDLGFTSYQSLNPHSRRRPSAHSPKPITDNSQPATPFKAADLVTLSAAGKLSLAPDATNADLYTYPAEVLRVVDGDTLILKIWLKDGHWLREKVRLRGIDCPELDTSEGKAAKRFVEKLVGEAASLTITTTKPDKWDRYLSDVFVAPSALREEGGRADEVVEIFLNNALLENGLARHYDNVKPADWEE
jgi:endonuclease YncB( thermonuclease family)